jgi:hypothetical protein
VDTCIILTYLESPKNTPTPQPKVEEKSWFGKMFSTTTPTPTPTPTPPTQQPEPPKVYVFTLCLTKSYYSVQTPTLPSNQRLPAPVPTTTVSTPPFQQPPPYSLTQQPNPYYMPQQVVMPQGYPSYAYPYNAQMMPSQTTNPYLYYPQIPQNPQQPKK